MPYVTPSKELIVIGFHINQSPCCIFVDNLVVNYLDCPLVVYI